MHLQSPAAASVTGPAAGGAGSGDSDQDTPSSHANGDGWGDVDVPLILTKRAKGAISDADGAAAGTGVGADVSGKLPAASNVARSAGRGAGRARALDKGTVPAAGGAASAAGRAGAGTGVRADVSGKIPAAATVSGLARAAGTVPAGRVKAAALSAAGAGGGAAAAGTVPAAGRAAAHSGAAAAADARAASSSDTRTRSAKRCRALISRGADSDPCCHPLVLKMQYQMDAIEEGEGTWVPSVRVEWKSGVAAGEKRVFGMQRPDGEVHIVRFSASPCTLNLAYDHDGDGCVKLIQICKVGLGPTSLYMEYYFVYPSEQAIREAAQEEDSEIIINSKTHKQIGKKTLREKARHCKGTALHHPGDILHSSSETGAMNLGSIVGTIAWVTKETLEWGKPKLSSDCERDLNRSLCALGIPKGKAAQLAADPIFLSCVFGERSRAPTREDDEDDDDDSEFKSENAGDEFINVPTTKDARAQRVAARAAAAASSILHERD